MTTLLRLQRLVAGWQQPATLPLDLDAVVDLEDAFRLWRFRHLTTVERVIGMKMGTGGTSGTSYLRRMLDVVLFPELWTLRSEL